MRSVRVMFVIYLVGDRRRARPTRSRSALLGPLTMPRWLKDNGLSIGFGLIFLASLVGPGDLGPRRRSTTTPLLHHGDPISFWHYVTSALFWTDVMENWQSEYLQFTLYIFATVWLLQKGSNESKDARRRGRARATRSRSSATHAKPDSPRVGARRRAGAPRSTRTRCCW